MTKLPRAHTRPYKFEPAGYCIYCGSDGGDLGLREEHIIPDALGGRLKYPAASCHKCERETHAFEGRIISKVYGNTRLIFGMRRGKNRKWPTHFNIPVRRDQTTEDVTVTEDAYPAAVWLVSINHAPPILDNSPILDRMVVDLSLWSPLEDYQDRLVALGPGSIPVVEKFQIAEFFRVIHKIAFAYAHAHLRGQFSPLTTSYVVRNKGKQIFRYVGGDVSGSPRASVEDIHELDVMQVQSFDNIVFIAVRVHLFALNDFPAYLVVVGTANAETAQPEGASSAPVELKRWSDRYSDRTRKIPLHPRVRFRQV